MAEKFLKSNALKKFNQQELRKLIQEQTTKAQKTKVVVDKIESPLAKYDKAGNLSCIICKTQVKPNVWKVHINSKQHKQKSETSKALVEKAIVQNATSVKAAAANSFPRSSEKANQDPRNSSSSKTISSESKKVSSTLQPEVNEVKNALSGKFVGAAAQSLYTKANDPNSLENVLPEKFFDEPKETKQSETEAFENEWSRFQKEIKEETSVSYQIEAGQHENAAIEREIEEIDDQLKRWQKVVEFENKTAEVLQKRSAKQQEESEESDDDMDDDDIPSALLDLSHWRSKKI